MAEKARAASCGTRWMWSKVPTCRDIAINKAYTAASFGMPTHVWYDFIKDDPPLLHGITQTPRLIIFGGGFPIIEDGQMIGAIGVSGGHYTEDMEVAKAALAAIGAAVG